MDDPYQVWVNVGDMFSGCFDEFIDEKQKNKNKLKSMSTIQQSLGDRFFQITGFRVDHKVFLAASRSFTNKYKKNNGRHKLEVVYSDWFREYLSVKVDCETVGKSNFFDNPVLTTVPVSSNIFTPTTSETPSRPSVTPMASTTRFFLRF